MVFEQQQHDYEELPQSMGLIDQKGSREEETAKVGNFRVYAVTIILSLLSSALTVIFLLALGLVDPVGSQQLQATPSQPSPSSPWQTYSAHSRTNCGTSIKEALSLNCTYDHLSKAWLPDFCPRDMNEEFILASENGTRWKYFRDSEAKIEIKDIASLAHSGPGEMWFSTKREHIAHCRYMILRLHRALKRATQGDLRIDDLLMAYGHTEHCVGMMYDMASKSGDVDSAIGSTGDVVFGAC